MNREHLDVGFCFKSAHKINISIRCSVKIGIGRIFSSAQMFNAKLKQLGLKSALNGQVNRATTAITVGPFSSLMRGVATTANPRPVYLDSQATTAMDKRVLDAMMPYLTEEYGNPHSRTHQYGWNAEAAVEKARKVL
jgi:hypothetical protein